jgi:succinate dehydrogenase flavin-adding protein (antitoxin of CptAB toxin-antitoxin module)
MVHDFDWLLGSVGRDHFFDRYFEKEILHISDRDPNYYENLFSEGDLDKIIAQSPEFVRQQSHASLQKRINPQVALRRASVSARSILHREPTARHRGLKEFPF